ncbi:MAG: copper-translocating P-type ATPase [bacterium]|jgi:Cu2+-exporting ATPase|nr:copper-translocating P-type ATPase [bacterium]MDD3805974.1 copper-translocating P-type ATPase [bacterium]MDD4558503.1 copper-translocating P-type ATPase [bacterium]
MKNSAPTTDNTEPAISSEHHDVAMIADYWKRFLISTILTLPLLFLSPFIRDLLPFGRYPAFKGVEYISFLLASFIYFYGGYPFLVGISDELQARQPGMKTLVATAITTAYLYSSAIVLGLPGSALFWELATLIDIMLLGHWLEMRSVRGASRALEELARLLPAEAHLLKDDGTIKEIPTEKLQPGNTIIIKPGERIPADGVVIKGETSVNEAMLTGEAQPVTKTPRDPLIGGAVNSEGSIIARVTKTGRESYLSQVVELVHQAQQSKSKVQSLADRTAMWLTLAALGSGALTLIIWMLVVKAGLAFALERTVTVMVIACPHALGLAIPLVISTSISLSASNGLLVRNRLAFERAKDIKALIYDKTGTLTEGKFGVTDILALSEKISSKTVISLAASIEKRSEHPIAQAIAAATSSIEEVASFRALPGKGAQGEVNGHDIKIVGPGYLRDSNHLLKEQSLKALALQGKTVVFVIMDKEVIGAIALTDTIKPEAAEAVSRLRRMGIKTIMLTGDNPQTAAWVAKNTGIEEYFAEILPDQKAARVKEIQERHLIVGMVGDGINDAPALAQADVGIAIGAGTDVALEAADVILVKNNPLDAVTIIELSRITYNKMVQNLLWATGYNIIALPLAAGVLYSLGILFSPAMGAIFMTLSTLIVTVNAQSLKL